MWLHYSDDREAVARGDEYLFGRDLLVAPVVEKGATSRSLYLPHGTWYDFWTDETHEGGSEITRHVDLATLPVYVRAGAVLPMGPLKQYTAEVVDGPLTLTVFPGANGEGSVYEDDGETFDFRKGVFMRIEMRWDDAARRLTLRMGSGSRMLRSAGIALEVKLAGAHRVTKTTFKGDPVSIAL